MDITITIKEGELETSRTFMLGSKVSVDWNEKVEEMITDLNEVTNDN